MAKRITKSSAATPRDQEGGAGARRLLEDYLRDLWLIRSSGAGVEETSYYPALSNLFNAVGKDLKPRVRCIIHTKNQGAGIPDGGLFTADQFQRQSDGEPKGGQLPSRGAIEVKGTRPGVRTIAESEQVGEYLKRYGIVLVTNLREFLIVERGASGTPAERESFTLAENEADFWQHKAAHPRATNDEKGDAFVEFLKRACLHAARLEKPKDVAWFLASYARDALFRVEKQKELPALQTVRSALEEALGMKFTEEKGEHFFRSTLVQTLFYGVFSAWVRWHKDNPGPKARFDWQKAEWSLHVPFIRTLYEEVAKPSRLGPLELVEVLDWAAGVLNRVDRDQFFKDFEDEHAVQYFYEPFLEAYDPELRKALGVWYTPPEIVKYQVARVDRVLREELDLPDGLADPNVIVLDPCCGTGAYLVETLKQIANNLREKHDDALIGHDVKQAAIHRVFGFEIMPAPFVVSHLQLGLMLQAQGAPLSQKKGERVGVYLTNALTGWEPPKGVKATKPFEQFHELQEEKDAAEHVKRDKKILVVLGNPPYNSYAGIAVEEERSLTTAYRTTKNAPPPEGQGLNDLYVRFFRMAERRITEMSGEGIVCFISNYSWLDGRSHNGMRERFLEAFDRIWIDCLNGDKYKTGKTTPEGKPDPSVFSTPHNREGIQVGTAIALMARIADHASDAKVQFRHFWGIPKLLDLAAAAKAMQQCGYETITPRCPTGFPLVPSATSDEYVSWPKLTSLIPAFFPGVQTKQDNLLVDIDQDRLLQRMGDYFDADLADHELASRHPSSMDGTDACDAVETRAYLIKRGFLPRYVVRYCFRPFDVRWLYWEPETKLLGRPSPSYFPHAFMGNRAIVAQHVPRREWQPPQVIAHLGCIDLMDRSASCFPLFLRLDGATRSMFDSSGETSENISEAARAYLSSLGTHGPTSIFYHALVILHAPDYSRENSGALRQDWPRIPLPADRKALEESATLGEQITALLDTEADVPGVTCGQIAPVFKPIGVPSRLGGGELDENTDDLAVTAGWGHFGKGGVVMPAKGKLAERAYDEREAGAIDAEASARGILPTDARRLLGDTTCDVYLNNVAYWRNIPRNVWEYTIGGYQVIKKWLSYREDEILGRALKPEEAREVMNMARRIAAIVLLQPKLDENYRAVKAATYDWPKT
ncbi:MAG: type ISP restriction/modification enzyme [Pirellulales bacterium]